MIFTAGNILLIGSVLLFVSIIVGKTGYRFGVPALLLFLVVGMLFGSDGLGLQFHNAKEAQFIGMVALSIILFSGGMDTKFTEIKPMGAHRLPAGRYVAAARRHGPQTGRILHPAAFDAAGHVFHGRGGQFPALLPGHGTGFGADGLPGGVRQVQAPFGRSGCEIHPLRLVRERSDALRHI